MLPSPPEARHVPVVAQLPTVFERRLGLLVCSALFNVAERPPPVLVCCVAPRPGLIVGIAAEVVGPGAGVVVLVRGVIFPLLAFDVMRFTVSIRVCRCRNVANIICAIAIVAFSRRTA